MLSSEAIGFEQLSQSNQPSPGMGLDGSEGHSSRGGDLLVRAAMMNRKTQNLLLFGTEFLEGFGGDSGFLGDFQMMA